MAFKIIMIPLYEQCCEKNFSLKASFNSLQEF